MQRFVRVATERLLAPLEPIKDGFRLPLHHLPLPLRERLAAVGIDRPFKLTFTLPAPPRVEHVHRAHPLVAALADYIAERALAEEAPELAARSGAIFSDRVDSRTTVYLLRLRSQLHVETLAGNRVTKRRHLLSEECLAVKVVGHGTPEILTEDEAAQWVAAEPSRNMAAEPRQRQIVRALGALAELDDAFTVIAEQRAKDLLDDHTRVRAAGL